MVIIVEVEEGVYAPIQCAWVCKHRICEACLGGEIPTEQIKEQIQRRIQQDPQNEVLAETEGDS